MAATIRRSAAWPAIATLVAMVATLGLMTAGIALAQTLQITTTSPLPGAAVGVAYSQTLVASGGTAPYTFSCTDAPSWLTVSSDGTLSGTPTTATTYNFEVTVTDAASGNAVKAFALTVGPSPLNTFSIASSAVYLTPTHTCETLPVSLAREVPTAVRAFSVRIRLSPELQLCTPVAPGSHGSISEGDFLSSYGTGSSFQTVDNHDGTYTVDGAILGGSCGPTALNGTLFSVGVTSTSGTACQGTVSIESSSLSPRLRDCSNSPLPVAIGSSGTVPIDLNPPVIAGMPGDLTVNTGPGAMACEAAATWTAPTASDLCGGTVTLAPDHAPGTTFPLGATLVTYTATDGRGNTASASFTVTVMDNTVPTIAAPTDVSVNADPGVCYATGVALGSPTTGDNCGVAGVTNDAPAQFPVGSTPVTWTVTDIHGNAATATQQVTVVDNQNPTITAPVAVNANADLGLCYATGVVLGTPTIADNCPGATATSDAPAQFAVGSTTVTWTVTDAHGHTATATQLVTVVDDQNPTITAPVAVNANADLGQCYATGVALGTPTIGDNCPGATATNDAPSQFAVGNTTVTWTVTDAGGRTATATQQVTVVDNQNPTITAPLAVNANADLGQCYATGVVLGTPTIADNCPGATATNDAPAQFPVGNTTVTWTVTDAHGHTATAPQLVTVVDDQNPTITAPVAVNANADLGLCYATGVALGTPTIADNCPGATATNDAPAQFPVGNTTVTWTVRDAGGRTATATQLVTVVDNQAPALVGMPPDVTVNTGPGVTTCAAVATWTAPTATDNCSATLTSTHNSGDSFPVGATAVTYTATDPAGHVTTATFTVTVVDNTVPVLVGMPADQTVSTGPGSTRCEAPATWAEPTASDNCPGAVTITSDHHSGDAFPVGATTVTYTARDAADNVTTATFTVTVRDDTPPVVALTLPNGGQTWLGGTVETVTWTPATDNCSIASVDLSYSTDGGVTYPNAIAAGVPNTGSFAWTIPGIVTTTARVRVTARDAAGNVTSTSSGADFTITSITAITDLAAVPVTGNNDQDGTTKIRLTWSASLPGTTVKLYRVGFGNYPEYDDPPSPGAAPALPVVGYPPVGWTLAQTVTGAATVDDEVTWPGRDFYYYVAFVEAGAGVSAPSNVTDGTLNYLLGDVANGAQLGHGDNTVNGLDISLLGSHYGASGPEVLACDYLDVGPTSTGLTSGLPLTDNAIEFEDLVIFALDYGVGPGMQASARPSGGEAGATDALVLERPGHVAAGGEATARLLLTGSGTLRAVSTKLSWDPAVVEPVGLQPGDWLVGLNGVAFSPKPGRVDAAVMSGSGMKGAGLLATVTFRALAAGDPRIALETVDGRDGANHKATVNQSERLLVAVPTVTRLAQAAPNPFRQTSTVAFSLAQQGQVDLAIFSVDGRRVRTLVNESREPGEYREVWDGRDDRGASVSAGVYYAHLSAGKGRFTHTIVYLK